MVTNVQAAFEDIPSNSDNEFYDLHSKANNMAEKVGKVLLTKTHTVGRQILRNNVVSDTPENFWRCIVFYFI